MHHSRFPARRVEELGKKPGASRLAQRVLKLVLSLRLTVRIKRDDLPQGRMRELQPAEALEHFAQSALHGTKRVPGGRNPATAADHKKNIGDATVSTHEECVGIMTLENGPTVRTSWAL